MTSTTPIMPNATPDRLLALVNQAFDLVRDGARGAAEFFAHNHNGAVNDVSECERELDRLDREFDDQLGAALAGAAPKRVTELVAGLKLMVDLERIGDLLLSSVT